MSKGLILSSVCHKVEQFPQPEILKNPGGDCFACATFAALRWMYPEREFTFDEVWDTYTLTQVNSDGTSFDYLGNSWLQYPHVFKNIVKKLGLKDFKWKKRSSYPKFKRFGCDVAHWNRDHAQYGEYWHKMRDDIVSGGVVFLSVNMEGEGPWKDGRWNNVDHVILIDGARERQVPIEAVPGASRIDWELHTVCSRKGCRWITVHQLLDLHGAGSWHVLLRKGKN